VGVLHVPPLRQRQGDLSLLIDRLFESIKAGSKKSLSAGAKNVLLNHPWVGNVRELVNTLHRLVVWSEGETIDAADARAALITFRSAPGAEVLHRPLGDGFDLRQLLTEVAVHYLRRAVEEAQGNKTEAAKLVGLPSYQTLSNWLARYKVTA
jgi:DNA-binding NtrC family response regulator